MIVPTTPSCSTITIRAIRVKPNPTVTELNPSTNLVSNNHLLWSSNFKNSDRHLRYQRRTASVAKITGVTAHARTSSIQAADGCSSSNKKTHGRRKKRKRANADIIAATATATATTIAATIIVTDTDTDTILTNVQSIITDDNDSIANNKDIKRRKDNDTNTNITIVDPEPSSTDIVKKIDKRILTSSSASASALSSSLSPSPSLLIPQSQVHSKKYPFPHKLYDLLTNANESGNTDIVSWSSDGTVFVVHDHARFASEFLPTYFGHSLFRSFDRQLNYWEFEKVSPKKISNKSFGGKSWKHPFFQKNRRDLLANVLRKKKKDGPLSSRRCAFIDDKNSSTNAAARNTLENKHQFTKELISNGTGNRMEDYSESSDDTTRPFLLPFKITADANLPVAVDHPTTSTKPTVSGPTTIACTDNVQTDMLLKIQSTNQRKVATELRSNIDPVMNQDTSLLSSPSPSLSPPLSSSSSMPTPLPEYVRTSSDMIATALNILTPDGSAINNSTNDDDTRRLSLSLFIDDHDVRDEVLSLFPVGCFNGIDKDENENKQNNFTDGKVFLWNDDIFGGKGFHEVSWDNEDDDDEILMSIILNDGEESDDDDLFPSITNKRSSIYQRIQTR